VALRQAVRGGVRQGPQQGRVQQAGRQAEGHGRILHFRHGAERRREGGGTAGSQQQHCRALGEAGELGEARGADRFRGGEDQRMVTAAQQHRGAAPEFGGGAVHGAQGQGISIREP
jgi:hypothetical protein